MGSSAGAISIPADALRPTWEELEAMLVVLSDDIAASGVPIDRLVVLPRGGLFPANIISRRLDIPSDRVLSAAVTSYATGAVERGNRFAVGQFPTAEEVAGKSLLVIDEVCDTGHTLARVVRELTRLGAANVRSAVLHYKPQRSKTGYRPDFCVAETDTWVVYPWELHEQPYRTAVLPVGAVAEGA